MKRVILLIPQERRGLVRRLSTGGRALAVTLPLSCGTTVATRLQSRRYPNVAILLTEVDQLRAPTEAMRDQAAIWRPVAETGRYRGG